jgi:membrane-associated phospholipid phosphatase
MTIKAKQRATS